MLITATLPAALAVAVVAIDGSDRGAIRIALASSRPTVPCPACGTLAQRVHSRYQRTLADLPWQGLAVTLTLETRRFFCEAAGCERWTYESGKGKGPMTMPYWTPPTDASDDAHALLPWARRVPDALVVSALLALLFLAIGFWLSNEMLWPMSQSVGGVGFVAMAASNLAALLKPSS